MKPRIRTAVRAMAGYTPGEQPAMPDIVKLNTNENPYPPSPRVLEALAGFDGNRLRLYPDPLSMALRRRLAENHGVDASRVFAGNGSDEVLALCTRAFVEDGGTVGCFDPSYSLYPVLAEIRGVRTVEVSLAGDFGWPGGPGAGTALEAARGCSLFFMARPNAPTGVAYPRETVRAFCEGFDGAVLIDEAYVDFARDDCMDLARALPNVLVARTLSKSFSLAGLRMGYAVGSAELIGALYKVKDSYNLDALTQALALAAVSDLDHMRRQAERIRTTRERLAGELRGLGWTVCPSEANFLWARPPAGTTAERVFRLLRERHIVIRYFPGPRTGEHVRITIGTDAEVDRLLAALG